MLLETLQLSLNCFVCRDNSVATASSQSYFVKKKTNPPTTRRDMVDLKRLELLLIWIYFRRLSIDKLCFYLQGKHAKSDIILYSIIML